MCRSSFASTLPPTARILFEGGWLDWPPTPERASARARIQVRVLRFEAGNLGDHKAVGEGVWEARLDFGAGYRVYFAKAGRTVILLLVGGDKRSQAKDIAQAKLYWAQYREETKHGKT
jgi:putative addiction module killer protein